jgi:hypothetical protein
MHAQGPSIEDGYSRPGAESVGSQPLGCEADDNMYRVNVLCLLQSP